MTRCHPTLDDLTASSRVTVVCAHPDDESFGLGAVITTLADAGVHLRLVCLTRGEASTLGAGADLAARRARELDCAAQALGIEEVELLPHPDGDLAGVPAEQLADEIIDAHPDTEALLTFDAGGITGHPDHQHATRAAVRAARRLGVPAWGWALPAHVAAALRAEFDVPFVGRDDDELTLRLTVDRTRQRRAIACHGSQLADNDVPRRRIDLQGPVEVLRLLHDPAHVEPASSPQETDT